MNHSMYKALVDVAKTQETFTNDDVIEHYTEWYTETEYQGRADKRALGPVVQKALKNGVMAWTGNFVVSRRPSLKMLIKVYRSNVYEESLD